MEHLTCLRAASPDVRAPGPVVSVKKGTHGPTGEDLFAQLCMQKQGTSMLDTFD